MTKGWYGEKQRHSMASKGVRSGNFKRYKANGTVSITDGSKDINIDMHNWGFEINDGEISLRLGNWSDAGWFWSGDESDLSGYLIRLSGAGQGVDNEFVETMKDYGISFEDLKEMIIESAKSGNGIYEISGDNVKWHFGQDGEREIDIIRYSLKDEHSLTDKEVEEFEDYYWSNNDAGSTDFDKFTESQYYNDLKDEIIGAVERSDSWEEVVDQMSDLRDVGTEASWEFSDNAIYEDIYENFNKWNKTDRWDKEVESGLPDDETINNLIDNFGRVGTMKKILSNYWDVESLDEAKNLVKQYEKDAIPKGRRKIEKEQKRMGDY